MSDLPSGTVTFLFTDLVGSTRLWETEPEQMRQRLADHDTLLRTAVEAHSGRVVKTTGDGLHAVFGSPRDALLASVEMQSGLNTTADGPGLLIRVGIHTGEAEERDGDYFGTAVNRAARIAAAAHGGQILCSGATAELVQDQALGSLGLLDLGMHRLRDLSRPEHLWQVTGPGLPDQFPPLQTRDIAPGYLPTYLDEFIGRDESVAEVAGLLETARLVTLIGVGGVGKTRLAIHAAATVADRFPDGTWFVELGPIGDPALVPYEIARTLGIPERPGRTMLELLVDVLADRDLLLVIDNCEHLLGAVAGVVEELLTHAPTLKALATSREGLMIRGEQLWPVPSVAPDDACRLFASRAAAVRPDFEISDINVEAVTTICARLDGIPLAIELAASRTASMTPADIAARLDERFRLLTGGNRTALERHQTLRRAVDWSYGMLDSREQQLFRRLSVFAGSYTFAAAAAVTSDEVLDEIDVADVLATLVSRSLVVADESGPTARYRMLETLRAYGRELLDAAGETDLWRSRHALHYAERAEQIDRGVKGPDELLWIAQFADDQDDLRGALRWALDGEHQEVALRVVAGLSWTWWVQGAIAEGERAIESALGVAGSVRPDLQARIVADWALFAQQHVDWDTCMHRCRRAMELSRQHGADLARPYALLGMVESFRGHSELARDLTRQALGIANQNDDEWEWGYAMSCAVHAYSALGEFDRATELAAALVPRVRGLANPTRIADALLADSFAVGRADPRRACLELAEAADLFELVGNLPMGGAIASNGVQLALGAGDVPLAATFLRRRITTVRRARHYVLDPFLPLFALHICAVLRVGGLLAEAAVMLGASDALMVQAHLLYLLPGARVQQEPELRATLLTDEYRDAVARGEALNRDEVLDFADASLALLAEDSPLTSE